MSTNFAHENIAYWTKRAPSYSQVNQEELKTGQRAVWEDTLDSRIRAHFPSRPRGEIRVLDLKTSSTSFPSLLK